MCKKDKYAFVSDFGWYTSVLLSLAVMHGSKHGAEVANQLIEVALRVKAVRPYAVENMLSMLLNEELVLGSARATVCDVLLAAAWIVGEYAEIVTQISNDRGGSNSSNSDSNNSSKSKGKSSDNRGGEYWIEGPTGSEMRSIWRGQALHGKIIETLMHPRTTGYATAVQAVYLQAALKVFVHACGDCDVSELADIVGVLRSRLPTFMQVRYFAHVYIFLV
jgi:hypothetical protein